MSERTDVEEAIREVRTRYDALPPGDKAVLRRCRTADDVRLEGSYWRIAGALGKKSVALASAVVLFPLADHLAGELPFSFGRWLRRNLPQSEEGASLRVRRLVQSRDREELVHRLRSVIRLAAQTGQPVDWGVLGADVMWFGDVVRRRWTQDFFAPISQRKPDAEGAAKEIS